MTERRFYVSTIEGYPISVAAHTGRTSHVVATVIDSLYGTEHGRFASNEVAPGRGRYQAGVSRYLGRELALRLAEQRCAELNAWHEREGWQPVPPLAEVVL